MNSRRFLLILAACFVWVVPGSVRGQNQVTVLQGATLIDVVSATKVEDSVVVMEQGRIRAVGKNGQISIPAGSRVIDLKGKYLLPGLIDPHIHYRDWVGEILLAYGITSVLDQANPTSWSLAMKEAQQKGKVRAPRFFVTGNQVDGSPIETYFAEFGHMDSWISGAGGDVPPAERAIKYSDAGRSYKTYLDDPEEARREVRELVEKGVDAIKVHHKLTRQVLKAITDEAHRAGLSVVGHRVDAREAAELGMDFVEHTSPIAIATITDEQKLLEIKQGKILNPHAYMDPESFQDVARILVEKSVFFDPTLSGSWKGITPRREQHRAEWEQLTAHPALQYIPSSYSNQYNNSYDIFERIGEREANLLQEGYRNVERFMRVFVDEGGKLLASSDAAHSTPPGLGVHQNMELFVDAGISPWEALRGATLYPAQLLRKEKDLGTVEVGKLADLVVLGADPLADISNTRKIEMVFLDGEPVDTSFHPDYKIPIPRAVVDSIDRDVTPNLSNVFPNIATEGDPDLTVELTGQFWPSSKVTFNGVPIQSSLLSGGRLRATIPSALLQNVGTYAVQIEEPLSDRTVRSNRVFFVVKYR